jgi:phosphatidylglycerophosphatase A
MRRPVDAIAHVLSIWFGCGLSPYAPGTVGTLGAVPVYLLLRGRGPLAVLSAAALVTFVGVWAASRVARRSGLSDPQFVVIDEVAGALITLAFAPQTVAGLVAGVLLFRFFDIVKPWPAKAAERHLPSGWGIVMDDVAAGAWGAAALLLLRVSGAL